MHPYRYNRGPFVEFPQPGVEQFHKIPHYFLVARMVIDLRESA